MYEFRRCICENRDGYDYNDKFKAPENKKN